MARSHKERYLWRKKERNRTGKADPVKIQLHRKRFLATLARQERFVLAPSLPGRYVSVVFHARARFDQEEQKTLIQVVGQTVEIPFLTEDPADCHGPIARIKTDFDPQREGEILRRHVDKARFRDHVCHLEVLNNGNRQCSSVISCRYRRWDAEVGQALCTMPRS